MKGHLSPSACVVTAFLAGCAGASQTPPVQSVAPIPSGYMRINFTVAGPLVAPYQYEVVLNTSGNGLTPEFARHRIQWRAYSAAIRVMPSKGADWAEVVQYVPNSQYPNLPPAQVILGVTPSQFRFNANADGRNTEFAVTFERSILSAHSMKLAATWRFNAATSGPKGLADTMGRCATCFTSPELRVDSEFERVVNAATSVAPPSARIVSVGFSNRP